MNFVMTEKEGQWQLYKHSSSNTFCRQNNVLNLPSAPGAWRFAFIVFLISNAPRMEGQPIQRGLQFKGSCPAFNELKSEGLFRQFTWLKDGGTGLFTRQSYQQNLANNSELFQSLLPAFRTMHLQSL